MTAILIFPDQNSAAAAALQIRATMGLGGSTFLDSLPQALVDGRWFVLRPPDDAWLAGLSGYVPADDVGLTPVGEGAVHVPVSVTNFQARAVLLSMPSPTGTAGRTLFQDVDDALHAEGGVALQAWEYANDVTRDGPLVDSLGAKFGLSAAQLDQLFVTAAGISA